MGGLHWGYTVTQCLNTDQLLSIVYMPLSNMEGLKRGYRCLPILTAFFFPIISSACNTGHMVQPVYPNSFLPGGGGVETVAPHLAQQSGGILSFSNCLAVARTTSLFRHPSPQNVWFGSIKSFN